MVRKVTSWTYFLLFLIKEYCKFKNKSGKMLLDYLHQRFCVQSVLYLFIVVFFNCIPGHLMRQVSLLSPHILPARLSGRAWQPAVFCPVW